MYLRGRKHYLKLLFFLQEMRRLYIYENRYRYSIYFSSSKMGLIKMIFILNRNLKIKIDKNDFTSMSFWND